MIDLCRRARRATPCSDCRLLAEVYVELTGGRQRGLSLTLDADSQATAVYSYTGSHAPRPIIPTLAELALHQAFVARLNDPLWAPALPDAATSNR